MIWSTRLARTTIVALHVLLFAGVASAQPPNAIRVLAAETVVRVRADPTSPAIATVTAGTVLEVQRRADAWYAVWLPADAQGNRRSGYVAASDVEPLNGTQSASAPAPAACWHIAQHLKGVDLPTPTATWGTVLDI